MAWSHASLLAFRRERAIGCFPELAGCRHELFAFMSVYADRLPWSTYDREAQQKYLAFLRTLATERPTYLTDFLREEHGAVEITFRTLETINSTFPHDRDWSELRDVKLLRTIQDEVHPMYLLLCEGVLKWLLTIVAVPRRLKRGDPADNLSPGDLVKEARDAGIHPLDCFDSKMRNAIAHGSVALGIDRIEYVNRYRGKPSSRENTPRETLSMVEALLDVCNGMAAALRLFVLLDRGLLFSEKTELPPALVFPEVETQLATSDWHVDDYLELRHADGSRELNLFARTSYLDDHKTRLSVIRTASLAAGLMPRFDRYYVRLERRGVTAGWGLFDGAKVRELLKKGIDYGPAYLAATQPPGFVVFPALGRFHVPARLRIIGSIAEVVRTGWAARRKEREIEVREVEIVGKGTYSVVTAHVVLHERDLEKAVGLTLTKLQSILRMAVRAARRLPEASWWVRHARVGYLQVFVFFEDRRRRELVNGAWDANHLCRLLRKTRGMIPVGAPPEVLTQMEGNVRIDWNAPVMEPLLEKLKAPIV
jgi:hypothetical protein